MGKHVMAGFVGAAAMFVAMSAMGAARQDSTSEISSKLDQLRAIAIMGHHKEIVAFFKPMSDAGGKDPKVSAAMVPFLRAISDLGKDDDGAAVYYTITGKMPPEKPSGK